MPDKNVTICEFSENDNIRLVEIANNINIAKNMRDGFPNPYTIADANNFIAKCLSQNPKTTFAIKYNGFYVGNIGLFPGVGDNIKTAEIAYFIDEKYWNKGIASKAIKAIIKYAFETLGLIRMQTGVFEYNISSMKVIEKTGFIKEAIFKAAIYKNKKVFDEHRYSLINQKLIK